MVTIPTIAIVILDSSLLERSKDLPFARKHHKVLQYHSNGHSQGYVSGLSHVGASAKQAEAVLPLLPYFISPLVCSETALFSCNLYFGDLTCFFHQINEAGTFFIIFITIGTKAGGLQSVWSIGK
jgi:hypothetical protein